MTDDKTPPPKSNNSSHSTSSNSGMDPYYLHPSDHPGHVLVPEKLDGTNYSSWSKAMILDLRAKNKIGFINRSIKPPSETEHPTKYAQWSQCNIMILSWILHSVESHLGKGVVCATTAHQSILNREKNYRMMQFLMGLNDIHDTVRTGILMMTPLPNVHQAYSFVSNHEQQRQLTSQQLPSENFSLAAAA
ncbi:hypothetical protein L6164_023493 [Bauhinia variegata]|uniref:Uncharacterized protein n=1 Tax=Bauhinia variegata TaxID=167791 RepID=A0ACB9MII1_BAUVA|nr:hypothetical protein L6164_023493 [Bauhinia variegata]